MFKHTVVLLIAAVVVATAATQFKDECIITDYSQVKAVTEKCTNIIVKNLKVPGQKTLELHLTEGSFLEFQGTTSFEYYEWKGPLLDIQGKRVHVRGAKGHVLHGNGQLYWDGLGAKGVKKPKFMSLGINDSLIEDINVKNCPVHCISIKSDNLTISGWNLDVSEGDKNNFTGHNTDGFDVSGTNLIIKNSVVRNQDDCVVVNRGANITVSNVICHGGHGLSISVGFSADDFIKNSAFNITFENSIVNRSPNGIHIKTHSDSGPGVLKNITYRNITIEKITNFGINIQQDYENGEATGKPGTNIPIIGLKLENISGQMESYNDSPTLANYILCGDGACSDWNFSNINIKGAQNASFCNYVPKGFTC